MKTRVYKERVREKVRDSSDGIFGDLDFGGGSEPCTTHFAWWDWLRTRLDDPPLLLFKIDCPFVVTKQISTTTQEDGGQGHQLIPFSSIITTYNNI